MSNVKNPVTPEVKGTQGQEETKVVTTGNTGVVTNKTVLDTILNSKGDEKVMEELFQKYPDLFINTASKYLPVEYKVKAEKIIQGIFANFTFTSTHKRSREEKFQALIEKVKQMVADKADKNEIIELILNNRKSDIKTILLEIM